MRFGDPWQANYDDEDEMSYATADCRNFRRRNDFNSFNMVNYEACENCKHFTSDCTCGYRNSMEYRFDMS